MDVTRTAHTSLDVLQESLTNDCWNVDVDRNLSDSWTGFTTTSKRVNFVQIWATTRPDCQWPEIWSGEDPEDKSMHASWKLMNPRESVSAQAKDHEDHIAAKDFI